VVEAELRLRERRCEAASCRRGWMWCGLVALALAIGVYAVNMAVHPLHLLLSDVDLAVYRDAGLVASRSPSQLYQWQQSPGVRFTYTPFAAALCIVVSVLPWGLMVWLMLVGSVAALVGTVWLTVGALGWRGTCRLGAAAAVSAVAFWLEPVQQALHSGEVDLLLMLVVVADLANKGRRWQGAGIGVAAGIKLVALIFIPYLLLTGRYRQAGAAAGVFAATVATGALLFPRASASWWLGGAFLDAGRTGFVGYLANQSLLGLTTRLAGTVPAAAVWAVLALLAGGAGLALAARVHRRGWPVHGWAVCAVTGLIVSPVSWDHHWVWIAPVLAVLTDLAVRARGAPRAAWWAAAGLVAVVFGAWPSLWRGGGAALPWGLIWYAPATPVGAGGIHPEYHWAGLQLLAGNLYLLTGLAMLTAAAIAAATPQRHRPRQVPPITGHPLAADHLSAGSVTCPAHDGRAAHAPPAPHPALDRPAARLHRRTGRGDRGSAGGPAPGTGRQGRGLAARVTLLKKLLTGAA
jgi:alpha-1,2-mannosyltransferase